LSRCLCSAGRARGKTDDYVDVEEQAWRRLVSNLHALTMPIDHADCPPTVDVPAGTQRVEA
jgi:hypothetical protein